MSALKVVAAASTVMSVGVVVLLQEVQAQPALTGAVLLSASVLALQLYLLRRVQSIPAEEGVKRHDAMDRVNGVIIKLDERFDTDLQRMEARLTGAINEGFKREAEERRIFDTRLREVERYLPRPGDR